MVQCFFYELSVCGFESHCCPLNFRYCTCFKQRVPWHLGNYWVYIHYSKCTWHDKNIKSNTPDKHSQHSSIIWPIWLNGWVFLYELGGCGLKSHCFHLTARCRACFEQGVPWHSGNYRMWIHSETHM